jgi:hypothetical protein
MVAHSTWHWLVLLASSTLASCVIVTERPIDSAPPPAPAVGEPVPMQAVDPTAAAGGSQNKPLAAALAPSVGGTPGAPQAPAAAGAGGPGLGASY